MIKVIGKSKKACFKGENEIKKHCVMNSQRWFILEKMTPVDVKLTKHLDTSLGRIFPFCQRLKV